jgi:hypothetical protein
MEALVECLTTSLSLMISDFADVISAEMHLLY